MFTAMFSIFFLDVFRSYCSKAIYLLIYLKNIIAFKHIIFTLGMCLWKCPSFIATYLFLSGY